MKRRIALAYCGSLPSSAAVAWLREQHHADVVTVTVDIGQSEALDEVRQRALACGAVRAHVIDARDVFARDYALPALAAAAEADALGGMADPLIARTLLEVASIESADAVAHASASQRWDELIARLDRSVPVVAPAREWDMDAHALVEYTRVRHLPGHPGRAARHLLIRPVQDPARAPDAEAQLDIAFDRGVPVSINGVTMTCQELIESLSLIAGQHGVGFGDTVPAPGAVILRAAYRSAEGPDASVRFKLHKGSGVIFRGHSDDPHGDLRSVFGK
jgi:argininosuccinate synthase